MDRRGFIAGSLLASVAAGVAAAPGHAFGTRRTVRLERFIIDERFPDARAVADTMARRNVPVSTFSADLTALWYEVLDLKWRERPEAFGGMTTKEGLFVLETLAADRGMRVVFRAEHAAPDAEGIRHAWQGPESWGLTVPVGDWRGACADALLSVPRSAVSVRAQAVTAVAGDAGRTTSLYSWVIAPRTLLAARA